jgi:hypothetical protein
MLNMKKDYLAPATEIVEVDMDVNLMQISGGNTDDLFNGGAIDTGSGFADDDE